MNTLLGANNPGGKTPVTWYPSSILARDMHDMDLTSGDGLTHLYYKGKTLWPFAWGLSYTTFTYAWTSSAVAAQEALHSTSALVFGGRTSKEQSIGNALSAGYECTVTNTGKRAGDAVVLGFVNSTDPQYPRQKLFDFERVSLNPGETKTVPPSSCLQ